ncbi:MAG: hypothetical protein ABSG94_01695 [Brevinematales bacterium]|jgi:hypothetical protein
MKRLLWAAALVSGFAMTALADVNLNVDVQYDYRANFDTNSAKNNYNADANPSSPNLYGLNWGAVYLSGDIINNVKGNFLYDVTAQSIFSSGVWYANLDWAALNNSHLIVGLQNTIFGIYIPGMTYGRTVDTGVTWTQDFGIAGYALEGVAGVPSTLYDDYDTTFDGTDISGSTQRNIPTFEGELLIKPVLGLTLGVAGRLSEYNIATSDFGNITNNESGLEGYVTLAGSNGLLDRLSLTLDYAELFNSISYTGGRGNTTTNVNSYYFASDINYNFGSVISGLKYVIEQSDTTTATNGLNQWIDVYAKILIGDGGHLAITPYVQYNLDWAGSSTPENIAWFRVRLEWQFDFPVYKEAPAKS